MYIHLLFKCAKLLFFHALDSSSGDHHSLAMEALAKVPVSILTIRRPVTGLAAVGCTRGRVDKDTALLSTVTLSSLLEPVAGCRFSIAAYPLKPVVPIGKSYSDVAYTTASTSDSRDLKRYHGWRGRSSAG
ncbi:hypothetical protein KC341_g73 [Hortaea werneckii]|nr:hypothetical protein KC341_g73 [Hortaea werneckii]